MVALSSAEAEFWGISKGLCEFLWLKNLISKIGYPLETKMKLYCDNRATIQIAQNPVQYDRTKYMEVDRNFIKEKLEAKIIKFSFIKSKDQLVYILTKTISSLVSYDSLSKMGIGDIYAPT